MFDRHFWCLFCLLFTGIRHLPHVLTVPPTKACLLCATPAGMDLYIQVHDRRLLPNAIPCISEDRLLYLNSDSVDFHVSYPPRQIIKYVRMVACVVHGCHISAQTISAYACMVASTSSVGHNLGHGRHCFQRWPSRLHRFPGSS